MALDPLMTALLEEMAAAGKPPLHEQTPVEARAGSEAVLALGGEGAEVASVVQRDVGGVPAAIYTPDGTGLFPVLVWIHGGGFVLCDLRHADSVCRDLADRAGCVVVSLDYRLAPEHTAPAAADDCIAATEWVLANAGELGGDPSRVAVGGDSAGGNLSAVVANHFGDRLVGQLLVYPWTDLTMGTPAIDENGEGYFLTKLGLEWFAGHYLDQSGVAAHDPTVSPLFASDEVLAKAPPAFVLTAEFDPLRDDGEAYAGRLQAAGVPVRLQRYDGQIHAFYVMKAITPDATAAIDASADFLRSVFTRS